MKKQDFNISIVIKDINNLNYNWLLDAIEASIKENSCLEYNDVLLFKERNISCRKLKNKIKIYIGEKNENI